MAIITTKHTPLTKKLVLVENEYAFCDDIFQNILSYTKPKPMRICPPPKKMLNRDRSIKVTTEQSQYFHKRMSYPNYEQFLFDVSDMGYDIYERQLEEMRVLAFAEPFDRDAYVAWNELNHWVVWYIRRMNFYNKNFKFYHFDEIRHRGSCSASNFMRFPNRCKSWR
jgi:hypothetical protein